MRGALERLADDTAAALHAAPRLATLSSIIYELAVNAIAANASRVYMRVDLVKWTIECADNGDGFPAEILGRGGVVPHMVDSGNIHARGETLACLAHLGVLQVISRIRESNTVISLLQRGNRVLDVTRAVRRSGSCVTIHGVFGAIPVRRRAQTCTPAATRRLKMRICETVRELALAHPDTSFTLECGGAPLLSCKRQDLLARCCHVYGSAFADPLTVKESCPVDMAGQTYTARITAVVSRALQPALMQHISFNGILVPKSSGVAQTYTEYAIRQFGFSLDNALDLYVRVAQTMSICLRNSANSRRWPARWRHLNPPFVIHIALEPAVHECTDSLVHALVCMLTRALLATPGPLPVRAASAEPEPAAEFRTRSASAPPGGATEMHIRNTDAVVDAPCNVALDDIRVIAQVDRKFILCVAGTCDDLTLLCMDQHAVDERVRLEDSIATYVTACVSAATGDTSSRPMCSAVLPKPVAVTGLTDVQAQMDTLTFWGFEFGSVAQGQCVLTHVPTVLRMQDADALAAMLSSFCTWLKHHPRDTHEWLRAAVCGDTSSSAVLLAALRHLPPRFVEALGTDACKNAVRTYNANPGFNHILTKEQCMRLVLQQSGTLFPFQCAHGRPSTARLWQGASRNSTRAVRWARVAQL